MHTVSTPEVFVKVLPKIPPMRFALLMLGAIVSVALSPLLIAVVAVFAIELGSFAFVLTRVVFINREGEIFDLPLLRLILALLAMLTSCFALATLTPLAAEGAIGVVHVVAMLRIFGMATVGGLLFWLLARRFRVCFIVEAATEEREPAT